MAIFDLYSKRKAAAERPIDDVYSYDLLPNKLRSQIKQIFAEGYKNHHYGCSFGEGIVMDEGAFEDIVDILRREYGVDSLTSLRVSGYFDELLKFLDECEIDNFLDCIELLAWYVLNSSELFDKSKAAYIEEINHRIRACGLGYECVDGRVIRIDSRVLHKDILKPTLAILSSSPKYAGAEQEILDAFEKVRAGDNKGAVADALKAFESTMKAILGSRDWEYRPADPASKLIKACFDNELVPSYMQTHFTGLRTMLESGVPTVRNKVAGHGQGAEVKPLDDHFASYVLYTALANMKLLIDCDKALR